MKSKISTTAIAVLGLGFACPAFGQSEGGYITSPLYLNASKLPRHFKGHDPEQIVVGVAGRFSPKREFETKAKYNSRLFAAKAKSILGKLTVNSLFATMIDQRLDDTSGKPVTSYNADTKQLSMILWFTGNEEKSLHLKKYSLYGNSYRASNAYGAETDVIRKDSYEFNLLSANYNEFGFNLASDDMFAKAKLSASVPLDKARRTKRNLHTLAIYKLVDPYVSVDKEYTRLTYSYSVEGKWEKYYLSARIQELWLYDFETGEIVSKIKRRPEK